VGDGVHDDAAAIQRALDRGAPLVTIPRGVYRIGQTLRIGSNTTLRADAQAVVRLADGAGTHAEVFLLANRNPGNGNVRITVEGGIWDGNNAHNRRGRDGDCHGYTGTAINLVNVKQLTVRRLTVRNPEAFSIRLGEVDDFVVEDIVLDHPLLRPNQDGVHVGGFSQRGVIRRIKAVTPNTPNDDMVALNADDDVERVLNLGMRRGPIRQIVVDDLQASGAYTFVRLLSHESPVENVVVRRVSGGCRFYAVNMNNWRFPLGAGQIRNVRLEAFDVAKTAYTPWAPALIHVTLGGRDDPGGAAAATLLVANGRQNRVTQSDGRTAPVREFSIRQGNIEQLWLNRSPERP
jgi:polygalacturonase